MKGWWWGVGAVRAQLVSHAYLGVMTHQWWHLVSSTSASFHLSIWAGSLLICCPSPLLPTEICLPLSCFHFLLACIHFSFRLDVKGYPEPHTGGRTVSEHLVFCGKDQRPIDFLFLKSKLAGNKFDCVIVIQINLEQIPVFKSGTSLIKLSHNFDNPVIV